MATTRIMSIHVGKDKTAAQCIRERLDYTMNPEKTDGGMLVSAHACSPETAAEEFMLYRQQYQMNTGRTQQNEVIAYHIRQAFRPGEITPETANEIGRELASRLTGDQNACVVATHIDKHHVHNHIIICSTALDCRRKYRDAKFSRKDVAQLSDDLCREYGLSVVTTPQNRSVSYDRWQGEQKKFTSRDDLRMMIDAALRLQPDGFDALMQLLEDAGCLIRRGEQISVKPPEGKRYIRLKSLGPEYDEEALRSVLSGNHVHIPRVPRGDYTESQVERLVDIEARMRSGAARGAGYRVWAERNNIDSMAQSVIYLKEKGIGSIEALNDQIAALQSAQKDHKAAARNAQARMREINQIRKAIRDYSRTKEVYTKYRESGWSSIFYQEHREEINAHKAAQAVYYQYGGTLPTQTELTEEYEMLKERSSAEKARMEELKPRLTALKRIQYNFDLLLRDSLPDPETQDREKRKDRKNVR